MRALASPAVANVTPAQPLQSAEVDAGGARFLATFFLLGNTPPPGWRVGIVAPEDYYTADLEQLRDRFLAVLVGVTIFVLVVGGLALRTVNRALHRILAATTRMRRFDFEATSVHVPFRDVEQVIEELERAKTAMRALSKYVPIEVVRQLHESNRDPVLGGELRDVSLMFTDIRDFTTLSEGLAPDALAHALGQYLQALTGAIRTTGGTIDKFIGDAVMTFWNAPTAQASHAKLACRAALACMRATRELYASSAWGRPPLYTRYGIHRASVMVGHFGSPERMSYTALGDGVNVASRLEGLCKQYEVAILVSQTIAEDAKDEFLFRLVDRVAVRGKHEPVSVYELLGAREEATDRSAMVARYEEALHAYFGRDFARAIALLEPDGADGPSRVLHARCLALQKDPPPSTWSGVFVATAK